ncbi:MAG: putative transport system permease protein [Acidobacteriota bacterium]|nr:putative transport system permease protein [Acidobacteriota bacterium]
MDLFRQDLRHALRRLAKTPGFTVIAVLTLALAIGANTAIWSVVHGLLLKPLPFPRPDRLVQVMRGSPQGTSVDVAIPRFLYWRDHAQVFDHLATFDNLGSGFNLAGSGLPERIVGSRVSRDFLTVLGVRPVLGRDFLPEEDRPGARRVALLSHGLWTRRFGADPQVLGRPLRMNGEGYTVVGVMPAGFRFPAKAELWTPLQLDLGSREKANYLEIAGRLRDGIGLAQARAAMKTVDRQFASSFPGMLYDPRESVVVQPLQERLYGQLRPALLVLMTAVFSVLLIACVNLANLQLARAAARRREIAIRSVLGAGAGRIVRQLLTESLLVAFAGGAAGLLLGAAVLPLLLAFSPAQIDLLAPIRIDGSVLAATAGLALLSGLLFGLAPALGAARSDPHEAIQEGSNRTAGGRRGVRVRRLLVIAEVALSLVLLTAAGLLAKSFSGLLGTAPGFSSDGVLTAKLSLPEGRYGNPAALDRFNRQVLEKAAAIPGVTQAAFATSLPLEGGPDLPFTIEGRYRGKGSEEGVGEAQYRAVTADLFAALRIPLTAGRPFTAADGVGAPGVALVNETAARRFWPKGGSMGARITLGQPFVPELADPAPRTVVGIVKDVRELGLGEAVPAIVYLPIAQMPASFAGKLVALLPMSLVVRTAGSGGAGAGLAAALDRAVWAVDPEQPVNDVRWMDEIVSRSLGLERFGALLLGVLALMALLLAAMGIYGVLSYLVEQRTREIGVRMALGATGLAVQRMVVGQGMAAVLAGVVLGLAGALGLTRLLGSLLVGVSAHDPTAFALAPVVLLSVALLASGLPALRASRMDPVVALQRD